MSKPVRVRFAPSPTGMLHIGGLRSALFSWLFARQNGGVFVLRIEDTDRNRLVPESVGQMKDSLLWLGLNWDEGPDKGDYGPYVQSERLEIYQEYASQLLDKGFLYRDYTSGEELDARRKEAQKSKRPFRFTKAIAQTEPPSKDAKFVLRFHIESGPDVTWSDLVRGEQAWQRDVLDDFVAIKSDGYPTYQFANVVDDHLMQISQVIRAAEWIPSTPKHILLYQAFGWEEPAFAHLPQVLGPDKAKLSKRHGAKSALEYRDEGYLPEAVMNFLALLGWNPGSGSTQEIFSTDELIEAFDLKRVQSSPAVFDAERLAWMNGFYIRKLDLGELARLAEAFWPPEAKKTSTDYRQKVLSLVQERLKWLGEIPELTGFFFSDPEVSPEIATKNYPANQAVEILGEAIKMLENNDFSLEELEASLRKLAVDKDLKSGQFFGLIRIAVTGKTAAPGLFETLHVLGKEASLRRLNRLRDQLA